MHYDDNGNSKMSLRFPNWDFQWRKGFFRRMAEMLGARDDEYETEWTVSQLDIQPEDQVLEIGFGSGQAIKKVAAKATQGLVHGVDSSATMVEKSMRRNARHIKRGLVDLKLGDVRFLPYPNYVFDKAFSIHGISSWSKPIDALHEVRRVLVPGGRIAITMLHAGRRQQLRAFPPDGCNVYTADELVRLLEIAGFKHVRVENCPEQKRFCGLCAHGTR